MIKHGTIHRVMRVTRAVLQQACSAILTILVLSSCVFLAMRLLPGDPTNLILGDEATEQARAQLRHQMGLDRSLSGQWSSFLFGLLRLDFGQSLAKTGVGASTLVAQSLVPTAQLAGLAVALGACVGIVAAIGSVGILRERARCVVHAGILTVAAVPLLAFGPLLTWALAVKLPVLALPGDPDSGFSGLLFASALLSLPLGAQVARVTRAALLDQSRAKYLDVAWAKGAGPMRVWLLHAFPVAAPSVVVVVSIQLGALLGGAVVLERLFERPGLGTLMLEAYRARDLPILQAAIVAAGALFVAAQALAQIVLVAIDPKKGMGGNAR